MQLAFGTGVLYGIATADATGAAIANATPVQFGTLQDISGDFSFEEKLLYGSYQYPIAVGRGKGKLSFKAKTANITGQILSDIIFGTTAAAGIKAIVNGFASSVPALTPFTVTIAPPNSGTFSTDLGIIDGTTGLPLKKVASAPATGQYSVSAGVYTFASADASKALLISYEYTATSTTGPKVSTLTNQLMGYAPTFKALLGMTFQGKNFSLGLNQCVSSKFSLNFKNDDFAVPEFDFSAFADAAGNIGYIGLSE
jgi:hypothetical protein